MFYQCGVDTLFASHCYFPTIAPSSSPNMPCPLGMSRQTFLSLLLLWVFCRPLLHCHWRLGQPIHCCPPCSWVHHFYICVGQSKTRILQFLPSPPLQWSCLLSSFNCPSPGWPPIIRTPRHPAPTLITTLPPVRLILLHLVLRSKSFPLAPTTLLPY